MISDHVFRIQRYAIHDGPGIRTTLFFRGCPLACKWCHNPESQAPGPAGTPPDLISLLLDEIEKDRIFYDESGGGVTFSGGEPLGRPDLLMPLARACRERQIHTCLDTSGFAPFDTIAAAAAVCDRVLFDIKILDSRAHQRHTGRPADPVLDNLRRLSETGVDLKLRFPLIPTLTDTDENIDGIIEFLLRETRFRDIHILPFHRTGEGKYDRLNMTNHLTDIPTPDRERVDAVGRQFSAGGFTTIIGG